MNMWLKTVSTRNCLCLYYRKPRKCPNNLNNQLMIIQTQENAKKMKKLIFSLLPKRTLHLPTSWDILNIGDNLLDLERSWPICEKVLFEELHAMKRAIWKWIFGNISMFMWFFFYMKKNLCVTYKNSHISTLKESIKNLLKILPKWVLVSFDPIY